MINNHFVKGQQNLQLKNTLELQRYNLTQPSPQKSMGDNHKFIDLTPIANKLNAKISIHTPSNYISLTPKKELMAQNIKPSSVVLKARRPQSPYKKAADSTNQSTYDHTTQSSKKPSFITPSNNLYLLHMVKFLSKIKQLLSLDLMMQVRNQSNQIDSDSSQHTFIGIKLHYCLLKESVIKIKQYEQRTNLQCPQEFQSITKQYDQFVSDQYQLESKLKSDNKFNKIYNNNFLDSHEFVITFQFYLKLSLIYLNQYLDLSLNQYSDYQSISDSLRSSIILLDYLVILYLLIILALSCGDDPHKFEKESEIEFIANVQIDDMVTKIHFVRISQKLKKSLN